MDLQQLYAIDELSHQIRMRALHVTYELWTLMAGQLKLAVLRPWCAYVIATVHFILSSLHYTHANNFCIRMYVL